MAAMSGGGGLKEPEVLELIEKATLKDREKLQSQEKLLELTVMELKQKVGELEIALAEGVLNI